MADRSRCEQRVIAEPTARRVPRGRIGAADGRNLGDSEGQQGITKIEVSGRFTAIGLGRETAGLGFYRAEPTGFCQSYTIIKLTLDLGRSLPLTVVAGSAPTGIGEESVSARSHSASDRPRQDAHEDDAVRAGPASGRRHRATTG